MTMPDERTRALVWAGAFLVELARNKTLPYEVRRTAVYVARHYPTLSDIAFMGFADTRRAFVMPMLEYPTADVITGWLKEFPHGGLTGITHLTLPAEPKAKRPRRKPEKSM